MALPIRRAPSAMGASNDSQDLITQTPPVPVEQPQATGVDITNAALPDLDALTTQSMSNGSSLPELDTGEDGGSMPDLSELALPALDVEMPTDGPPATPPNDEFDDYLATLDTNDDFDDFLSASNPADESKPLPVPAVADDDNFDDLFADPPASTGVAAADAEVMPPLNAPDDDFDDIFADSEIDEDPIDTGQPPVASGAAPADDFDSFIDQAFDAAKPEATDADKGQWDDDFDKILDDTEPEEGASKGAAGSEEQPESVDSQEDGQSFKPLSKKKSKKNLGKKSIPTRVSENLFRILTLIPFVGRLLKPFQRFAKYLFPIIALLLIVGIPFGLYVSASNAIPSTGGVKFPDEGSSTISNFAFDPSTMTASATVTNTGDVIAQVQPVFTVWAYQVSLNPSKWTSYEKQGTCSGKVVTLEIDAKATVSVKCSISKINGITPKVSGDLVY